MAEGSLIDGTRPFQPLAQAQRRGMKLLFVDSNRGCWGMEQHFISLATGMARQGHEVRVVLRQGSAMEPILRQARMQVPTQAPIQALIQVHAVRFGGGGDPRLLARLFRLVGQSRPDWLIANDGKLYWPLLILGWLIGSRVALFHHKSVT